MMTTTRSLPIMGGGALTIAMVMAVAPLAAAQPLRPRPVRVRDTPAEREQPAPEKSERSRPAAERSGLLLGARIAYSASMGGPEFAGTLFRENFTPGPGFEADAGMRIMRGLAVYAGYERVFWGVGAKSPFASLARRGAWEDRGFIGFMAVPLRAGIVGLLLDASGGMLNVHQSGEDRDGGRASIDMFSWLLRFGMGASIEPFDGPSIRPLAVLGLTRLSRASTEVDVDGDRIGMAGRLADPGTRFTFAAMLTLTQEWIW